MSHYHQTNSNGSKINASKNDSDDRKIFVGGLSWESSSEDVKTYFQRYGDVLDVNIKVDPNTGLSRGFGFVLFKDVSSVSKVCSDKTHILGGKNIDPKPAVAGGVNPSGSSREPPCKKIFVGGLDLDLTQEEIAEHFNQYGKVELVELPYDKVKNQRRAFGFVTFESEDVVNSICSSSKIPFGDKMLDVRKAISKEQQEAMAMKGGGRGGGPMRGARGAGRARGAYGPPVAAGYPEYNGGVYATPYPAYPDYYGGYYGSPPVAIPAYPSPYDPAPMPGGYGDVYATAYSSPNVASQAKVRRAAWPTEAQVNSFHPYNR